MRGGRSSLGYRRTQSPRRWARKARGHGSWDTDRPPACGVVGRQSGHARLTVTRRSDRATLERVVREASWPMAPVNTDEWGGSNGLTDMGRHHATVCHADWGWDRDDDGDGVREVHDDTPEGPWIFLRPSRGVSKEYL